MKKINTFSLLLGIIAGIFVLCSSWALLVLTTFTTGLTMGNTFAKLYMVFCLIYTLGGLLSIVSGAMCFKSPFVARILLLVSCVLMLILPISIACLNKNFNAAVIPFFIPSVLTLLAGLLGIKKSKSNNNKNGENINHE